ncbi:MAG: pyridoxamine 5'-phosphate oxidase [Alphaproteobacteria bacterium]
MSKNPDFHPFLEPFNRLQKWIDFYEKQRIVDSNAMTLCTATADGKPSARMVLLKGLDENGPVFYTNMESRKGKEILANPYAALLFFWREPGRQVRIEGKLEQVSDAEADEYYASRPRGSRIGAWASQQSRPLESRFALEKEVAKWTAKFGSGKIERPPYWTGHRLIANRFEFWQAGKFRLHTREIYEITEDKQWAFSRLYP